MSESSPLAERRQRALEAADDARGIADYEPIIDVAIETATRVRITDEAVAQAREVWPSVTPDGMRTIIAAALTELGFEVER